MPNFKNMFIAPYQGIGPIAPKYLEEAEREKKRKVRTYIAEQSRMKKLNEVNEQSTLTDNERQDLTAKLGGMSIGQPKPMPQVSEDSYMPSYQDQKKQPKVNIPMELPEEDQTFSFGFGRNNVGKNLGLLNSDTESANTEDYGFDLPQLEKQKISSNQGREPLVSTPEDSRSLLYKYLEDRRKSEPEFQEAYQDRTRDAETGRVLNTFASGLGEAASMAGTLGGKRSQTGDMKALPNAIYNAQKNKADELMGLRRLSNQEQRGDIQMLRDLERGDLDSLRMQKILADLDRQKNQPKITPFYNFGDPDNNVPPSAMVMDNQGKFSSQNLPMGTMPTNSGYSAGPTLYDQQNNPILSQAQKSTGQYKFTPGPAGTKTPEIMRIENDSQAKEASLELSRLKNEMTNANAQERNELQRKVFELDKKIQGWKESQGNRSGDQRDRALDIQEDKANNPRPGKDVAGETLDKTFAKDYEQYVAMGGKDLLMQKLATLKNARDNLAKINPPPRAAGALGEAGIDLFAPEYAEIMSSVLGAIQETLRQTLGSQFTEKEGERILARSFNPRQTKEANLRNIDREIQNLVGRAKAKQASVDYYEKNGTLRGFKSDSGASGGAPKKQHNFKLNKTRFTYPDGRVEEKEGIL